MQRNKIRNIEIVYPARVAMLEVLMKVDVNKAKLIWAKFQILRNQKISRMLLFSKYSILIVNFATPKNKIATKLRTMKL